MKVTYDWATGPTNIYLHVLTLSGDAVASNTALQTGQSIEIDDARVAAGGEQTLRHWMSLPNASDPSVTDLAISVLYTHVSPPAPGERKSNQTVKASGSTVDMTLHPPSSNGATHV